MEVIFVVYSSHSLINLFYIFSFNILWPPVGRCVQFRQDFVTVALSALWAKTATLKDNYVNMYKVWPGTMLNVFDAKSNKAVQIFGIRDLVHQNFWSRGLLNSEKTLPIIQVVSCTTLAFFVLWRFLPLSNHYSTLFKTCVSPLLSFPLLICFHFSFSLATQWMAYLHWGRST